MWKVKTQKVILKRHFFEMPTHDLNKTKKRIAVWSNKYERRTCWKLLLRLSIQSMKFENLNIQEKFFVNSKPLKFKIVTHIHLKFSL